MESTAVRLEVDESIISRTLKINNDEEELQHLLNAAFTERKTPTNSILPYKVVKPKPGFCVKTKNVITGQKVFLNLCQTEVIPQPVEISESDLGRILESDEPSTFRVPMSLGEGHEEVDKSGHSCVAFDIAINCEFFAKVEGSLLFQTFVITAAMEGLEDKYSMELDKNGWTVLKNRKSFGTIRSHKIEQRHEKPYVQEVPKSSQLEKQHEVKPLIEEVGKPNPKSITTFAKSTLQLASTSCKTRVQFFLVTLPVTLCKSVNDITVAASVDTLTVKHSNEKVLLNLQLPRNTNPSRGKSVYNVKSELLTIILPLE